MPILAALLLLVAADSKHVRRDLDQVRVEYLVVAPPTLADHLDTLCDFRARSLTVAVVRTDDIAARHGEGAEGIAKFVAEAKPKFLLLAGDIDSVPTFRRDSRYTSTKYAGDPNLATDRPFGTVTGRFPADSPEELRSMIDKTLRYESVLPPAPWQKKIAFITGQGGFGAMIDAVIERIFASVMTQSIPPAYDIELAYAKPTSPYCPHPAKFNENAVRLLNQGSLFYVYVGHGQRTSFDTLRFKGTSYRIFDTRNLEDVNVRGGSPIMVVIACHTGRYDSATTDCIGEELLKLPAGPVAFIGGSRVTQPYGNALLGEELVKQAFTAPTIGEALREAQAAVLRPSDSPLRKKAATVAALLQGRDSLAAMREDVILHYNLLGDPAMTIRRPQGTIELKTAESAVPGQRITVLGRGAEGDVTLTFECARDRFCHPTTLEGDDLEISLARRYANANDKVIVRVGVSPKEGRFETELQLPLKLKAGTYTLKAYASGAIGACVIRVNEMPR